MKIRKSTKASIDANTQLRNNGTMPKKSQTDISKEEAQKYIKCAIDELGKIAKSDEVVKDSICNLSVILFDLK